MPATTKQAAPHPKETKLLLWFGAAFLLLVAAATTPAILRQAHDRRYGATSPIPHLIPGANPDNAPALMQRHGCGACHVIPGVDGANALVGPPLDHMASRGYVAGVLPNTPENLQRWILNPPAVDDKTAMPNLKLKPDEARDIAAYLCTLR